MNNTMQQDNRSWYEKFTLKGFSQGLDNLNRAIDISERFGISQLVRLSTYLGPAVPAYFVYEAAMVHLTHEWSMAAFMISFVLELLGLGVIYNLNNLFEWNRKYPQEQVSTTGATVLVFFYAAQISVIVFGLKISPDAFLWAAVFGLSSLSLLTGFAYAQGQQHKARVEAKEIFEELNEQENKSKRDLDAELREQRLRMELEIAKMKAQNELEIEKRKAEVELQAKLMKAESKLNRPVADSVARNVAADKNTPVQQPDTTERRNALLNMLQQLGDIGPTAFGEKLNADRTTIYRDFKALEKAGIVHLNGNGWTVGQQ